MKNNIVQRLAVLALLTAFATGVPSGSRDQTASTDPTGTGANFEEMFTATSVETEFNTMGLTSIETPVVMTDNSTFFTDESGTTRLFETPITLTSLRTQSRTFTVEFTT